MRIDVHQDIMEMNNAYAADNRAVLRQKRVFTLNIMGAPGSGKTTLLERMLRLLQQHIRVAVIEGDLATAKDARRISNCGVNVIQINTDGGCHLDAKMINKVLPGFYLDDIDMLIIENVGNLVCPASFDLGEDQRMVVLSVAEGADKPSKYPTAFLSSDIAAINKIDMLPHTDFDLDEALSDILAINPKMTIFQTCCRKGQVQGVDELADYLIQLAKAKRSNGGEG